MCQKKEVNIFPWRIIKHPHHMSIFWPSKYVFRKPRSELRKIKHVKKIDENGVDYNEDLMDISRTTYLSDLNANRSDGAKSSETSHKIPKVPKRKKYFYLEVFLCEKFAFITFGLRSIFLTTFSFLNHLQLQHKKYVRNDIST